MAKGINFERDICKQLSLWWSNGKTDDIFWRTSGSGARAKTRSKTGQATFGQYGDVQATDPIGQPLLDVCNIELKRGYSTQTIAHLLDTLPGNKLQTYELFIKQAIQDHKKAGSYFWMLIVKRDRRQPMVYIPMKFYREITDTLFRTSEELISEIKTSVRIKFKKKIIFGCPLSEFFRVVKPKVIKKIAKEWDPKL